MFRPALDGCIYYYTNTEISSCFFFLNKIPIWDILSSITDLCILQIFTETITIVTQSCVMVVIWLSGVPVVCLSLPKLGKSGYAVLVYI